MNRRPRHSPPRRLLLLLWSVRDQQVTRHHNRPVRLIGRVA